MEKPGIFIQFSYNGNEIEGIDEFKKELDASYPNIGEDKWLPSCSEGGEFWTTIFCDVSFWTFVGAVVKDLFKDVIVSGGKKFIFEPLRNALSGLWKTNKNKWPLKVMRATFKFRDFELVVGGLKEEDLDKLTPLIKKIDSVKGSLNREGCFGIKRIEVPAEYLPGLDKWSLDNWRFDNPELENTMWIVTYRDGFKALYDSRKGQLMDINYKPEEI